MFSAAMTDSSSATSSGVSGSTDSNSPVVIIATPFPASHKLSRSNFSQWLSLVTAILNGHDLLGYVTGDAIQAEDDGDGCEHTHGVFECWLHLARYRTQSCKEGTHCHRRVFFFAHTPEQIRIQPYTSSPDEI